MFYPFFHTFVLVETMFWFTESPYMFMQIMWHGSKLVSKCKISRQLIEVFSHVLLYRTNKTAALSKPISEYLEDILSTQLVSSRALLRTIYLEMDVNVFPQLLDPTTWLQMNRSPWNKLMSWVPMQVNNFGIH